MDHSHLYTAIIRLNAEAAEAQAFEVAYHLLAAALHAAENSTDEHGIEEVIRLATDQGAAVDALEDHPMASINAARRGTTPLYATLATMARAKLAQINAHEIIDRKRSSTHD